MKKSMRDGRRGDRRHFRDCHELLTPGEERCALYKLRPGIPIALECGPLALGVETAT